MNCELPGQNPAWLVEVHGGCVVTCMGVERFVGSAWTFVGATADSRTRRWVRLLKAAFCSSIVRSGLIKMLPETNGSSAARSCLADCRIAVAAISDSR